MKEIQSIKRNRKKMKGYLVLIFAFFYTNVLFSANSDTIKPYLYWGIFGGGNYNLHSADFRELPGIPNCCPKFEKGDGIGFHFGGLLRFPLSDSYSIGVNLGYITLNGTLQKDEIIGNTEIRNVVPPYETTEIVKAISNHSVDGNFSAITAEPRFIWNFFNGFRWNFGFQIGFLTNATFSQREKILEPNNIVFTSTGTKIRNEFNDEELKNKSSLQIHGKSSIGYELKFGKDMLLIPEIGFSYPFSNLYSGNWKVMPVFGTLALEIPIKPSVAKDTIFEINYIRDTLILAKYDAVSESVILISKSTKVSTTEKKQNFVTLTTYYENYEKITTKFAGITGDLYIRGMDEYGTSQPNPSITVEEIEVAESFPLLPYIFFRENSSNLNETSLIVDKNKAEKFNYSSLPWETLDIYSNLLNIIKFRLDKNASAKIKITGTNNNNSELNNGSLSKSRAEAVKNYFVNELNISSERIETSQQNLPDKPSNPTIADGIQENQRAEITSKNIDILSPVELSQIEKRANPPIVELIPEISSTLPIKSWYISLSQNGNTVRKFSGNEMPTKQLWIVAEEPIPQFETPIDIVFSAQDSLGKNFEIRNSLSISQKTIKKKREEIKNDTTYLRYSLIVFDFDKSELTSVHRSILSKISEKIKTNSLVSIYGYSDRTGTSQYNKELANRRIEEVVNFLKLNSENVRKYPIGSDELLFDNSTPQGRSYSRTVKIIIATPIK